MAEAWELGDTTRPNVWSDEEWAAVGVLVRNDRGWLKPAYAPQLFGVTGATVRVLAWASRKGAQASPPQPWTPVSLDWPERKTELSIDGATLSARVGPWPNLPSVLRRLLEVRSEGVERETTWTEDGVGIRVHAAVDALNPDEALQSLDRAVLTISNEFSTPVPGQGYDEMSDQFTRASLTVPYVPPRFRRELAVVGRWAWASTSEHLDRDADYLLKTAWMDDPCPDQLAISQGGGGVGGGAITYRLAWGPVALMAQGHWGGFNNAAAQVAGMSALLREVGRVVRAAEGRADVDRDGHRRRVVQIAFSTLRPLQSFYRYWSVSENAWVDIEHGDDTWDQVAEVVAGIPLNP